MLPNIRTSRCIRRRLWACSFVIAAAMACRPTTDGVPAEYSFQGATGALLVPASEVGSVGPPLRVVALQRGSAPGGFGGIGVGGTLNDRLYVADNRSCSITVIADSAPERVLGRCGDGPGDLRNIGGLVGYADTLFVLDAQSGRLHRFDTLGAFLGTVPYQVPADAREIQNLVGFDDTSIVVSVGVRTRGMNPSGTANQRLLAKVSRRPPFQITWSPLSAPAMTTNDPLVGVTGFPSCGNGRFIVVLNRWAFESIILDSETLAPRTRVVSHQPWPEHRAAPDGTVRPSAPYLGVACGDRYFVVAQFEANVESSERPSPFHRGVIEVREYDGTLLVRHLAGPTDTLSLGIPFAVINRTIAFRNNAMMDEPTVVLMEGP